MMSVWLDSPHSGVLWGSARAYRACRACRDACCWQPWRHQDVGMPARADAESNRSGPHAHPEARTLPMVDFDGAAPWQADDVTSYDAAAQDADDATAIVDGSPDDATTTTCCRAVHHDAAADDGAGDDCGPLGARACCGHCVADGTCAARLSGGHGDAAHDLAMPPEALAVCESRIEPFPGPKCT